MKNDGLQRGGYTHLPYYKLYNCSNLGTVLVWENCMKSKRVSPSGTPFSFALIRPHEEAVLNDKQKTPMTKLIICSDCGKVWDYDRKKVCPRCNRWDIVRAVLAVCVLAFLCYVAWVLV